MAFIVTIRVTNVQAVNEIRLAVPEDLDLFGGLGYWQANGSDQKKIAVETRQPG